jgi:hypothetical protein
MMAFKSFDVMIDGNLDRLKGGFARQSAKAGEWTDDPRV